MGMYQKSGPPGHKKLQYPLKRSSSSSKNKTHATTTTTAATTSTTAAAADIATGASNTLIDSNNDHSIAANYTDISIVNESDRAVLTSWKDVAAYVGTRDAGENITVMYCSDP